jgi:hypothetical protein
MKLLNPTMTKVSLALLLAWGATAHAEVVGRVLVSVGDNAALRAGKEVKLAAGTPIETGDTLRVGDASNLQVRFTDEAIMALRPNSSVRIDEYAFANKADSDKSIFSLLKGGLRTITGVIGRNSRSNYAVKAETATIGIRGTHYNLVHCNNDCRNLDGTPGENGTFGGVTDGRISVTNKAGEREFGKNEFFHVLSLNHLPVGLISPPGFLRDRLEGQAKTRGKDKAPTAGRGTESGGTTGGTGTSTQPSIATTTVFTTDTLGTTEYVPADQRAVQTSLINPSFAFAGAWAGTYDYGFGPYPDGDHEGFQIIFSGALPAITEGGDPGIVAAMAAAGGAANFWLNAWTFSFTYDDPYYGPTSSTVSKGAAVEVGTDSAANLTWGRALVHGTDVDMYGPETWKEWDHFVIGDPVTALPTSGNFLYSWIGGTSPTDSKLVAGTLTSGGSINVSFGASSIGMQTVTPITWTMPADAANPGTYKVAFSGSTQYQQVPAADLPPGVSASYFTGFQALPSPYSSCPSSCNTYIKPQFMGANAQALGLGIYTWVNGNYIASAQAYKR